MTPSHPFWLDIAGFFLEKGFAVPAFDKAGTGRSAGDWRRQDFTARARDALAAYGLVGRVVPAGYLGRILRYDPSQDIRSLSQPVLAIFAENDRLVHAAKNAEQMEALLRDSASPAWFVRQVPGADHFFRPSGFCDEPGDRWEWAPGFWEALDTTGFWRAVASGRR